MNATAWVAIFTSVAVFIAGSLVIAWVSSEASDER